MFNLKTETYTENDNKWYGLLAMTSYFLVLETTDIEIYAWFSIAPKQYSFHFSSDKIKNCQSYFGININLGFPCIQVNIGRLRIVLFDKSQDEVSRRIDFLYIEISEED